MRDDLEEVLARQRLLEDEARAEAVARRHAAGRRTARANLTDLIDDDTFVEYGGLVIAAQRSRRSEEELFARTPADGIIAGIGRVAGRPCAVLSYDYLVLAGTQGMAGHRKTDRVLELIERQRLPVVFFAEGGGGRPGDVDEQAVSWLQVPTFARWAGLSGLAPRIAIASGRCFAGNAAIAGCADLIVATEDLNLGMGGPAMIAGGGLGHVEPEAIGPIDVQAANGVVDVVVSDDAAAVAVARQLVGLLGGGEAAAPGTVPDQTALRDVVPERRRRAYDVRPVVHTLADEGSVVMLRDRFAPGMLTALARIEGRAVGFIANNTMYRAGTLAGDESEKAARFLQLCNAYGLPVISLIDTPGFMVGPAVEETAMVRRCSRLFVAGAALRVPLVAVILRKAYGLGAQAMAGGSLHEPLLTVAWPTAELGAMGLEGSVRLGFRRELDAIDDPGAREARVQELTAAAQEHAKGLNAATYGEVDDVIDPADTRALIVATLTATPPPEPRTGRGFVDTW